MSRQRSRLDPVVLAFVLPLFCVLLFIVLGLLAS